MFCNKCGMKISDDSSFCKFCGAAQTPTLHSNHIAVEPMTIKKTHLGRWNLSPIFYEEFIEIAKTEIGNDTILEVANCTNSQCIGFFIVTDKRIINVRYFDKKKWNYKNNRPSVRYYHRGGGFFDHHVADDRYWTYELKIPLSKGEIEGREMMRPIYSDIRMVEHHRYQGNYRGKNYDLLELLLKGAHPLGGMSVILRSVAFEYITGLHILKIINDHI